MIAALISRSVVFAIYVGGDNSAGLDAHIVHCCGDCARVYGIGITASPTDLNGVS